MSELMSVSVDRQELHWRLLTTVSIMSLLVSVCGSEGAIADDQSAGHPAIWIELGAQMEQVSGQGKLFTPDFLAANPDSPVLQPVTPVQAQKPSKFSFGEEGKISIQPVSSDWVFSAGLRYGRSSKVKHVHHQTTRAFVGHYTTGSVTRPYITSANNFADTLVKRSESHTVLDFSAGREVGIGMFGKSGSSILGLGVRFAQFTSKETMDLRARPDLHVKYFPSPQATQKFPFPYYHVYHATGSASRSFRGLGPSLSWNGSQPFTGNERDGELAIDWGVNLAVLFGKQKAHTHHQESAHYISKFGIFASHYPPPEYVHPSAGHPTVGHDTDRSVVVPNVGASIGLSWHIENFKASLGYRTDFFFGAVDGGIDERKSETLSFRGPFATIGIGLGG